MTPLLEILIGYGFGGFVAGIVVWLLAKNFMPAYLAEKGKNLAQKEDIKVLTRSIEQVKTEQAMIVERFKSVNQLRVAAIDKRLAVHQDAYVQWVHMFSAVFDNERRLAVVGEAWKWWVENNLYLEPAAREAFRRAISATQDHHLLVNVDYGEGNSIQKIRENFHLIKDAGEAITRAVALPGLSEAEQTDLREQLKNPQPPAL